ncbi:hypothetical protein D3C80_1570090 [compost metagenome]
MLTCCVAWNVDTALVGQHGADVDDFASASFEEMTAGDLGQQEYSVLVEVDYIEPVFFAVVLGWSTADHACAVNEDVYFAGQFQSLVKCTLQLGVVAQVS